VLICDHAAIITSRDEIAVLVSKTAFTQDFIEQILLGVRKQRDWGVKIHSLNGTLWGLEKSPDSKKGNLVLSNFQIDFLTKALQAYDIISVKRAFSQCTIWIQNFKFYQVRELFHVAPNIKKETMRPWIGVNPWKTTFFPLWNWCFNRLERGFIWIFNAVLVVIIIWVISIVINGVFLELAHRHYTKHR
jgi:hypothetical protein